MTILQIRAIRAIRGFFFLLLSGFILHPSSLLYAATPEKRLDIDINWQQLQPLESLSIQQGAAMRLGIRPKLQGAWLDITNMTARWEARQNITNATCYQSTNSYASNSTHTMYIDLTSANATGTPFTNWIYSVILVYSGSDYPLGTGDCSIVASAFTGLPSTPVSNSTAATLTQLQSATSTVYTAALSGAASAAALVYLPLAGTASNSTLLGSRTEAQISNSVYSASVASASNSAAGIFVPQLNASFANNVDFNSHDLTEIASAWFGTTGWYLWAAGAGSDTLTWANGMQSYTVWHSGNDGAGSGLDADTLDGSHASSFITSSGGELSDGARLWTDSLIDTNGAAIKWGNMYLDLYPGDGNDYGMIGTVRLYGRGPTRTTDPALIIGNEAGTVVDTRTVRCTSNLVVNGSLTLGASNLVLNTGSYLGTNGIYFVNGSTTNWLLFQ